MGKTTYPRPGLFAPIYQAQDSESLALFPSPSLNLTLSQPYMFEDNSSKWKKMEAGSVVNLRPLASLRKLNRTELGMRVECVLLSNHITVSYVRALLLSISHRHSDDAITLPLAIASSRQQASLNDD
jgi:hypothetical protein